MKRMLGRIILGMAVAAGAGGAAARADTVVLKDGTVREGTIIKRTAEQIQLQINDGGIRATMNIPVSTIAKITEGKSSPPAGVKTPDADLGHSSAKTPALSATTQSTPALPAFELPPTRGFLYELAATALNHGPDDPARLPAALRGLWDDAVRQAVLQNPTDMLAALRRLDDAFSPLKGGPERLNGICQRERGESFGEWLANVHWQAIVAHHTSGPYVIKEVRASELGPLIGILKEKTGPALAPLRSYFPPVDDKTGKTEPFHPTQLQGIGVSNALEVQQEAAYASAILLAQMKLEPQMPAADRVLLSTQLQTVGRILSRAGEIEPAAKAAAEKAAREKRIAEQKARQSN